MKDYELKLELITAHAWEMWLRNGNKLTDDRKAAEQQVRQAAEMTYYAGISDLEWLSTTLRELGDPFVDAPAGATAFSETATR